MIVFVYGYDGSGEGHWQRWLAAEARAAGAVVEFPELPDPTEPQRDAWVGALRRLVETAPTPVTFVCHSLGCWAVDHLLAERGAANVHAALLVAPPSPFLLFEPVESFLPPPRDKQAWVPIAGRSLLIGSDDDDFTSADEFSELAAELGIRFELLPAAGHINVASGYGPWPRALAWLREAAMGGSPPG